MAQDTASTQSSIVTQETGTTRTLDVRDGTGAATGTAELPAHLFDVQANIPLIHQVVVAQQAAARQGTHSTKTRGDVRGGGAKPWRQKGTGRARQGSRRSPQWTGGGTVHGPQPRSYKQRTPKKMVTAALRGALSDRARGGCVHVVSGLVEGEAPSTRSALAALAGALGDTNLAATKVLVVLHRDDDLGWLSLRNAAGVHALAVDQLNAYDVLCADDIVFTRDALDVFVAGPATGKGARARASESETAAPGAFRGEQPPAGYDIKGNEDSMKFHAPTSPWYDRTVAEVWFNSAAAAEAAGFVNAEGGSTDDTEEADK